MSLRSDDTLVLVVSVLAIVGVALVAATLGSMAFFDVGGNAQPELREPGAGWGDILPDPDNDGDGPPSDDPSPASAVFCVEFLTEPASVIGLVAGMLSVLYLVYLRMNASAAVLAGSFLVPVVMFAYFFLTNCSADPDTGPGPGVPEVVGDSSMFAIDGLPAIPPALIGALLVGMVLVAATVLVSMSGRDEHTPADDATDPDPEADAADFAHAARRARQRIEEANVPVDNAVYQAWVEMTGLLSLEAPETAAPYEFAHAAIDVGLAESDVYELTELFNDVRYGERDAGDREGRAIAVLKNIEETYEASVIEDRDRAATN